MSRSGSKVLSLYGPRPFVLTRNYFITIFPNFPSGDPRLNSFQIFSVAIFVWKSGSKQFLSLLLGSIFCTIYESFLERDVPGRGGLAALVTPRPDRKPSAWSSFETVELSFPSVLPILIINSDVEPEMGRGGTYIPFSKRGRNRRKE